MNNLSTDEAKALVEKIRYCINDVRKLVLELYERKGWEALGYSSWRECVVAEFDQSQSRLYQLLDAAKVERNISTIVENDKPITEGVLRPLVRLSPDKQRAVWEEATRTTKNPTAKEVKAAVEKVVSNGQLSDRQHDVPPPGWDDPPTPAQMERKLQEQTDEGLELIVWNKIKDRFVRFWLEFLDSLEPDERGHALDAVEQNIHKIRCEEQL